MRETRFDLALDEWVRAALARGVRTFPDLVRSLPGVYPTDAVRAVSWLGYDLPSDWQMDELPSIHPIHDGWPVEHPLDFDWRFTPEAVRLLMDRCLNSAIGPVTVLGAPSLACEAAAHGWSNGISIYDRNKTLVTVVRDSFPGITVTCTDLVWGIPVSTGDAAVAIADPPWYPEHIIAFLWAASRLTDIGGQVLLSLPSEGTRPGILAERKTVLEWATAFGLRLVGIEPGVLGYRTPPFERNALAAAGVPVVLGDWRRGDLAVFKAADKILIPRPTPPGPTDEWEEESVGTVRIKCRRSVDSTFRDPRLSPVVAGDMLPSVSRRDPIRKVVDVWTCGNRVFRCAGTGVFRAIVSALGRGADVHGAVAAVVGRDLSAEEVNLVRQATG